LLRPWVRLPCFITLKILALIIKLTFSSFQVSGQFGPQEPEEPAVVAAEDVAGGRKVFRQHHHAAHGPGGKQGGGHEGHAQVS
jgi:hypothetical protein